MLTAAATHDAITREWGRVLDALTALDEPAWARPTRCVGWTLLDLARHATWGTSMEADAIARARAGTPGTAQGVELDDGTGPADTLAALRHSVGRLSDELARAGELGAGAVLTIPFGAIPAEFGWDVFTMEAGIHADDVATALGDGTALSDDVVAATAAVLAAVLPPLAAMAGPAASAPPPGTAVEVRGASVSLGFAYGDGAWRAVEPAGEGAATVEGDDTAVLLYALGRIGAEDPRLRVGGGAEAFKRWFPGP